MRSFLLVFLSFFVANLLFGQSTIRGKIQDADNGEDLIGATIAVEGTKDGGVTDFEGNFNIRVATLPAVLRVSYTGYQEQSVTVTNASERVSIKLKANSTILVDVEIVGQRISDKEKKSPLSVENLDALAIKETPSVSFYSGLGNLKGVDLTTASIGFTIVNTRGFNSTSPVRSLQIIDGVDNQAPGLNFSLGNFLGASELDVLKVDMVAGASGPFFGPNAFNGVISIHSKNPFVHKGLSASLKAGERELMEGAIRWADVVKNKAGNDLFAYKFNLYHLRAYDWVAENFNPVDGSVTGINNPGGYDAVNKYGDEYSTAYDESGDSPWANFAGIGIHHRNGYAEEDLVDYNTRNTKANAAIHFRLNPKKAFESPELIFASNFGTGTTVYQGDNRFSLKDILFFQNRIELKKQDKYFIRAYATNEDAGKSYDPYFTALKMLDYSRTPGDYRSDYQKFWGSSGYRTRMTELGYPALVFDPVTLTSTFDQAAADQWFVTYQDTLKVWHQNVRKLTEATSLQQSKPWQPYLVPGTPEFEHFKDSITSLKSGDGGGTKFFDQSALYHMHGEYRFTPNWAKYLVVGANTRLYRPNSEGTIFVDTLSFTRDAIGNKLDSAYTKITNYEFGMYTGIEKEFLDNRLTLAATLRLDKNQNFDPLLTPALSAVYSANPKNILRFSFSSAIRNPTLTDQYLNFNVGRATLLGNLNGFKDLITIESFQEAISNPNAVEPSKFVFYDIAPIAPEKVKSFEVGYRTTLWNAVFIDAGYYFNIYNNFIGYNIGLDLPDKFTTNPDIINVRAYRVAANSSSTVNTNGFNIGLNYYFRRYYQMSGNYSWNKLRKTEVDDPIIPAFNTPEHKFNIALSARDLPMFGLKKTGFNVTYKWVDGFVFEGSPQFSGNIPTYDMVDMQWNTTLDKLKTTLKIGVTNLFGIIPLVKDDPRGRSPLNAAFNNAQFQTYGGPRIGRMAYIGLTYVFAKE
jgi:iron complex outermembrane recepter protein